MSSREPSSVPRTRIERGALRNARELRRAIGAEVRRLREDAGLTLSRLAREAAVSKGHLHDIEAGRTEAGITILARISAALGGRLAIRIEAGVGPPIRDHLQAAMLHATVVDLHPRWKRFLEVAIHRPVSGVIDLVIHDPDEPATVATEAQSQLRRFEQQLR